jgi:catechol 2,3-dioxygenase-like lactoylglutathione lyase family enzyme
MLSPNYVLFAVQDPRKSAALYNQLLGQQPVESADTFILYVLSNGLKLGLWKASTMQPTPTAPGGVEVAFGLESREAVLRTYNEWTRLGVNVVQAPTDMDFGFTFVVACPDGHRLRPFVLAEKPQ